MEEFSCLISCYYKESPKYLEQALKSIQNQTLPANEIVFVEDGELTDELYSVIEKYSEYLPLKRVRISENKGLGNALNVGLNQCSYGIVLRMDTDDICFDDRFEKQILFFEKNPEIDICGGWAIDIDQHGNQITERKVPLDHEKIKKIIWSCPIIHPTVGYKKDSLLKIGSYDTSIERRQDYELWIRAAYENLNFRNLDQFLIYYRSTPDYYKKNNSKVALLQAKLGVKGLLKIKSKSLYAYFGVFIPYFRSLIPSKIARLFQEKLSKYDPRKV